MPRQGWDRPDGALREQSSRRAENEQMAREVAGVEHQKIAIDRTLLEIDRIIAQLEAVE